MKIVVFNLGCKVNQYDSDVIVGKLLAAGHEVSEKLEAADVYILSTCAVTGEAERKSRQAVGRALKLNPKAKVYVCGCASQRNPKSFLKDNVSYVSGVAKKDLIASLTIEGTNVCEIPADYEEIGNAHSMRTRSYLKVQDGCNNFCSYCIVAYLRGRSRSRRIENCVEEANQIAKHSKEMVVTGINLSAYGKDVGLDLSDLIRSLSNVDIRIRLGSLEANVIDEKLLFATTGLKNFCPHFHLSLQSGDNEVLKKMNRHYTAEEYLEKVRLIRQFYPDAAITTDIIAGFPTETEQQHKNTLAFAKEVAFADIHAFAYSKREGTLAAKMEQTPSDVIARRAEELGKLKAELRETYNSSFIGKPLEVLFEEQSKGLSVGYSKNYIRVYTKQNIENELKTIAPTEMHLDGLKG